MLEIVRGRERFAALAPDWNTLADGLGTPLLRHELFAAVAEARAAHDQLAVLVVRDGGGAVRAIAPLRLRRRFGARWLEFISHELHEPNGLLYADEPSLQALVKHVLQMNLPIHLGRLRASGAELRCFREQARGKGLFYITDGGTIRSVPLSPDFSVVEKGISADRRSRIRRFLKRAERSGAVEFVAAAPDASDLDGFLDQVFRIEASGWKGRGGSAILSDPGKERFFRLYGRAAAERRMLRVFLMRIAGETVAARFAIAHAGRLWELKIGYEERWRSCSPGILLTQETLRHACREGLAAHEFLGMSAEWQRYWKFEEQHHRTMRYYPYAVASLPRIGVEGARLARSSSGRAISAALRRLRPASQELTQSVVVNETDGTRAPA